MVRASQAGDGLSPAKVLAVGSALALFATVVIMLLTPPASGYEISLYDAYPWYFWAMLIVGLVLAQAVILRSALWEQVDGPYWRVGFLVALLFNAILLFQPYIRGYPYFERADVLTHLGYIRIIRQTGHATGPNIYPNIHQFVLTIAYATGLEPMRVINSVSAVIGLFSMLAFFALVKIVYDRTTAFLTLPFGLVATGSGYMIPAPFTMSLLLSLFVLYLFFREQQTHALPVRMALAIVAFATVIYHPLTTVFLLIVLLLYSLVGVLSETRLWAGQADRSFTPSGAENVTKLILAAGISWYYNFAGIIIRFEEVFLNALNPGRTETTFGTTTETISQTSPELLDVVRIALTNYGPDMVLLGLGGAYVLKLLYDRAKNRLTVSVFESSFAAGMSAFAVLSVLFLVFNMLVGFGRPAAYATVFGSLLAGPLLLAAADRFGRRHVTAAATIVLVVLVTVSVFGVFHSPVNKEVNNQVTRSELDGARWMLEHRERGRPVGQFGITLWRFEDALTGATNRTLRYDDRDVGPPPHFGYQNGSTLGSTYREDEYLVLTTLGRQYYPAVFPSYSSFWGFTPRDFERLESDSTVSKVYANGDFDMYAVNHTVQNS